MGVLQLFYVLVRERFKGAHGGIYVVSELFSSAVLCKSLRVYAAWCFTFYEKTLWTGFLR